MKIADQRKEMGALLRHPADLRSLTRRQDAVRNTAVGRTNVERDNEFRWAVVQFGAAHGLFVMKNKQEANGVADAPLQQRTKRLSHVAHVTTYS